VTRIASASRVVLYTACALALVLAPAALAAKGGGKGAGNNAPTTPTGSLNRLVLLDPTSDGLPHWNHAISFDVSSTAQYYFVRVVCSQDATRVYEKTNSFNGVGMTDYGLSGPAWTSGAADCTAVLYSQNWDGSNQQTLGSMDFHVYA
jgi:hypothetical protein